MAARRLTTKEFWKQMRAGNLLRIADVAKLKGVEERTVTGWIAAGRLAATKAGRMWWTTKGALEELTPARKRIAGGGR